MFSQLFSVKSFGADLSSDSFGMNLWLKNLRLWPEYYGLIRLRYGVIAYAAMCDVMPECYVIKESRFKIIPVPVSFAHLDPIRGIVSKNR